MKQFTVTELREIGKQVSMRYVERDNTFVGSHVTFNLTTGKAWSYEWYELARYEHGKTYINSHNYSISTCKHRHKIIKLFALLGVDAYGPWVVAPKGLNNPAEAVKYHKARIIELQKLFTKPRVRKITKIKAQKWIKDHQDQIETIRKMNVAAQFRAELSEVLK